MQDLQKKITDPFVPTLRIKDEVYASVRNVEEALAGADCVVFLVDHDPFKGITADRIKDLMASPVIVDGKNVFKKSEGAIYLGIGKGTA